MGSKARTGLLALLGISLVAGAAWAACNGCGYGHRDDRFEGVRELREIGDESFELLGVHYQQPAAQASRDLHIYFWLPSRGEPSIEVWNPQTNYWMVPDKRPYDKGLRTFSWPAGEVVRPLGLDARQLYVKVKQESEALFYPALLSSGAPATQGSYSFVFRSNAGFETQCTIAREERSGMVKVLTTKWNQDDSGIYTFEWTGRDAQGAVAPPGVYVLKVSGDLLSDTVRKIDQPVRFLHYEHFS